MLLASVIIPTYNRAGRLRRAIESVAATDLEPDRFEVVVVDNNSTDETPQVVEAFASAGLGVRRVEEKRLSFTVARHTGAAAARGRILAYIDDDVEVEAGWLRAIVEAFQSSEQVGVAGGPIVPEWETEPPEWLTRHHPMSLWLSLLDLGGESRDVEAVAGPNLAVRKDVLEEVGGFPPDTIGVEAEGRSGVVEKIYVGPGDQGLCSRVTDAGYAVRWSPAARVRHVIPPVRLTKEWWHGRLRGEGCYEVLTYQHQHQRSRVALAKSALRAYWLALGAARRTVAATLDGSGKEQYEFTVSYYRARGRTSLALVRHPWLADELWDAAVTGVAADEVRQVVRSLPV